MKMLKVIFIYDKIELMKKGLALVILAGCSSDPMQAADSGVMDASPMGDAMMANETSADVLDGGVPFVKPTPIDLTMSMTGPDQLMSVVPGPSGSFYAAGYTADGAMGTRFVTVVKLTPSGLDKTWATGGIAKTTIAFVGGADEIDVAAQPSGKLVVSATVANMGNPLDRDVAVLRLNADGSLDTTFGVNGVRVVDLNTAIDANQAPQRDAARGLAIGPGGVIFLHAAQRGDLQRTDSDFAVVKLTADGAVDATYGTAGKHLLDIGMANATVRAIKALPDGSVIGMGYASTPISNSTPQPVLYKLTPAGALDKTFADNGLFHQTVVALQTEIYDVGIQNDQITTGGYGRASGTTNDWISMRFDLKTGARDTKFSGKLDGVQIFDPSGKMLGSACRGALALPGGKSLLYGSTGPTNMPAMDAAFAILDPSGKLDTEYLTGVHTFAFGPGDGGSDQFWGAAVNGSDVMLVGWKGAGATQTDQANDDAWGVSFKVR